MAYSPSNPITVSSSTLNFIAIRVRHDNLMYLFYDDSIAFSVDAFDPISIVHSLSCAFSKIHYTAEELLKLSQNHKKRKLLYSLTTHSHFDHAGGNERLKQLEPQTIIIINDLSQPTNQFNESINIGKYRITYIHTPCHTRCSLSFLISDGNKSWLLTGDFIFKLGCGRFFEGSSFDFLDSIAKLDLHCSNETLLLYGHDYYKTNLRFAINVVGKEFYNQVQDKLDGEYFLTWADEKRYNPFINYRLVDKTGNAAEIIGKLRKEKDKFI